MAQLIGRRVLAGSGLGRGAMDELGATMDTDVQLDSPLASPRLRAIRAESVRPCSDLGRLEPGHGTTVTGHRPVRTRRTATDQTTRCQERVEAPTTTASALSSSAISASSRAGSPCAVRYSADIWWYAPASSTC